jgi:hypothetical protein
MVEIDITGGVTIVDAVHDGSSNFQVCLRAVADDRRELFVNEIGAYRGEKARTLEAGTYHLDVVADGDWWLDVRRPQKVGVSELSRSVSDTKARVIGPFAFRGSYTMKYSHHGERNFQVSILPTDGRLGAVLVNEIARQTGEVAFHSTEAGYVVVEADGEWTLEFD